MGYAKIQVASFICRGVSPEKTRGGVSPSPSGARVKLKREGRVWTAFSKGGISCYKTVKLSDPIRVHSLQPVTLAERNLSSARSTPACREPRCALPLSLPIPPRSRRGRPRRCAPSWGGALAGRAGRGGESRPADLPAEWPPGASPSLAPAARPAAAMAGLAAPGPIMTVCRRLGCLRCHRRRR